MIIIFTTKLTNSSKLIFREHLFDFFPQTFSPFNGFKEILIYSFNTLSGLKIFTGDIHNF